MKPAKRDSIVAINATRGQKIGLSVVFLWFFVGGIAHFAATDIEASIVPPYLPAHRPLVLISGVFELLGAAGLLLSRTRRAAGLGLLILTLAVTPANVYMLQRSELFPIPYWILVTRLPLQLVLLALIAWSTDVFRRRDGIGFAPAARVRQR
jgi:uncharacterized membrane protein